MLAEPVANADAEQEGVYVNGRDPRSAGQIDIRTELEPLDERVCDLGYRMGAIGEQE